MRQRARLAALIITTLPWVWPARADAAPPSRPEHAMAENAASTETGLGAVAKSRRLIFNIRRQPLSDALAHWSKQSGLQVLWREEDSAGALTAPVVWGKFLPVEALERMLSNTELTYEFINAETVRIAPISALNDAKMQQTLLIFVPPVSSRGGWGDFSVNAPTPNELDPKPEETTGLASASENRTGRLEEVTVTATRRSENVQRVPISISVFSGEDLAKSGMANTGTLSYQTPGLVMNYQSGALTPFIRGIGALDGQAGNESAIAMYVDGIYVPTPMGTVFSFNNVERVEVLKGPQGTLFGRNASGGLIQVVTRTPDHEPGLSGSVSYGNFETTEAKLYATGGVSESLATDLAVFYRDQGKGYGRNVNTGVEVNRNDELSLRSKWELAPSDDTTVTAAFSYSHSRQDWGLGWQFLPGITGLDAQTVYTGNFYNITGDVDPLSESTSRMASITVDHDFDHFAVKNIAAYQYQTVHSVADVDVTPLELLSTNFDGILFKTLTEELQFLSRPDSTIKWIVGAFFLHGDSGYRAPLGAGLLGSQVGGGVGLDNVIKTDSVALFGEATVALASGTNLTAGARWTRDKRELSGTTRILDPATLQTLLSIPVVPQKATFDKPTWRLMLDHQLDQEKMLYGSYSRGFKAGNFQAFNPADPPYQEEILDAFELGMKATFLSERLRLNPAVFYYKYDNQQVGVSTGATILTINAANSTVKGFELEGQARISRMLDVSFGVAALDPKIKRFPNAPCYFPNPDGPGDVALVCDNGGKNLPRAPEFTFNLQPTLTVPGPFGEIQATLSYYHNGGFYWDFANARKESAYDILNARIGWEDRSKRWGIHLFGDNLLAEKYSAFTVTVASGDYFHAAAPRTFGAGFNFNFE